MVKVVWIQRDNPGYRQVPTKMSAPTGADWPHPDELAMYVNELHDFFVGGTSSDLFPSFPAETLVSEVFYQDTEDAGRVRWASFVNRFELKNVGPDGSAPYATFAQKSIYFLPSCEAHPPAGDTGGPNTGILAKIPKLVK